MKPKVLLPTALNTVGTVVAVLAFVSDGWLRGWFFADAAAFFAAALAVTALRWYQARRLRETREIEAIIDEALRRERQARALAKNGRKAKLLLN